MTSSELRLEARKSLTGKWGKAALLMLVYGLITFAIGFVLNLIPTIGGLISFVIDLPISYGLIVSLIKLKRGEEISYTGFLNDGFNSFKQVWIVFGNMLLKLIIPFCLVVVFAIIMAVGGAGTIAGAAYGSSRAAVGLGGVAIIGIIGYLVTLIWLTVKSYLYSLSFFILYDNGEKSGKEIVAESESLMRGNRWKYFWLPFTFIGWMILAAFSFGIGYLWLAPYMLVTLVCFYEDLAGKKNEVEVRSSTEEAPVIENENNTTEQ